MIKHARIKSVLILVRILVVKMPNVELTITVPYVIVWMATLEILSLDVTFNHVRIFFASLLSQSCHVHFLLAPILPPTHDVYLDPCHPSPCGPFSQCRDINGSPSCSCSSTYIGSPPNCRPECSINAECPSNKACIQEKCRDPCLGSCGFNAICTVINHTPACSCSEQDTGDPFTNCYSKPPPRKTILSFQ